MRFPIRSAQVKFDRPAQHTLKQLHATHRSKMERQVAQGWMRTIRSSLRTCEQAMNELWERAMNRSMVSRTPRGSSRSSWPSSSGTST